MKHIDEIRRENMAALAKRLGGVAHLSKALDRSEAQVSQWIRGARHSATGKKRGMRAETARWIEAITNIPEGWLDTNHDQPSSGCAEPAATYRLPPRHARRLVQEVIDLAEQIDDDGLNQLLGFAKAMATTNPLVKGNARSSA